MPVLGGATHQDPSANIYGESISHRSISPGPLWRVRSDHTRLYKHRIPGFARHGLGQTHVHCLQGTIANRCDGFRPVSLHSCCIHTRNVRLCKACLRRRIAKDSEALVTDCSSIGTIRAPPLLYYFVPFPPAHSQLSITLRRSYMAQHPPVCLTLTS